MIMKDVQRRTWQHGCADPHACGARHHKTKPCQKNCKRHQREARGTASATPAGARIAATAALSKWFEIDGWPPRHRHSRLARP
jgi:hypothetical protein